MKSKYTCTGSIIWLLMILAALTCSDARAARARGVTLPPLDGAMVDNILESSNGTTRATIRFVNQSSSAVDIYWINYDGHRVLYRSGLPVGAYWEAGTYLTHPFLRLEPRSNKF